jgi:methionyl-tRNA synthetase
MPGGGVDLSQFKQWWPAEIVIGKDILIPAHGIYWLIILHALGFADDMMPRLIVHGWWNIGGAKMSKSLGNVVNPAELAAKYGSEALRYYLMSDIATGRDADFSEERLVGRYNADLANSLGNLLNRTLNMIHRYRDGVVERKGDVSPLASQADEMVQRYKKAFAAFDVHQALTAISDFATACNTYIDMMAPWKLAKEAERADTLDHVLYSLAESLRIVAILISPVLPSASHEMLSQLNWRETLALDATEWGRTPSGHKVGKGAPVFPRIET